MRTAPLLIALLPALILGHICDIPGICPDGFICVPDTPYSGNCVADKVCKEDTCPDGEICEENDDRSYSCMCPPGSQRHDTNCVEFCDLPHACQDPLMDCVPNDTSYDCICPKNYLIQDGQCQPGCQTDVCPDYMDCLLEQNRTISCLCGEGEVAGGEDCVPACGEDSCPRHMECKAEIEGYKCLCPAGFVFTADEQCVPECEVEPCLADESCVAHQGIYQCCPEGHLPHPETRLCTPSCLIPDICPDGLQCLNLNQNGSFSCVCPDDSTFNAEGECVEFCQVEPCAAGMHCSATEGGFNCSCTDDEMCKRCSDNPCDPGFVCVQEDFTHQCVCDEGYRLKHGKCVDIDECEYDICNISGAKCSNTEGGYYCSCPGNSYYNDSSNSCDRYNMCESDPCDTAKTRMLCRDLGVGFACLCPEDYPEELCAEQSPCDCGDHEECVEADGQYFCQCDKFSFKPISYGTQACTPDPEVKDAGVINPKKGVTFNLRLGETDRISLRLMKDSDRDRKAPWHLVSWYKIDKGLRITGGRTRTPEGHFKTPRYRQQVVVQNIRPEDGGTYMVRIEKPGYRPVSEKIIVNIEDPLTVDYGPKDIKSGNHWRFKVHLNAKLEEYSITWYRNIAGHLELLQEDGDKVKYESAGRQLTVEKIPGVYIARLRGSLPGPSATEITGEAEFQAGGQ